ncbi:hypothetical protein, partial [Sphaerotilus sp.]|uniref:hypothetical protein n=1 Tax=Sphaerotilus sp. TaxID=2093942 RepID=UPI0034E1CA9F
HDRVQLYRHALQSGSSCRAVRVGTAFRFQPIEVTLKALGTCGLFSPNWREISKRPVLVM